MSKVCHECGNGLVSGEKVYEDRYFFNLHCSWECLVSYMLEFFNIDSKPNVTVINGRAYYDEDLDENGVPFEHLL